MLSLNDIVGLVAITLFWFLFNMAILAAFIQYPETSCEVEGEREFLKEKRREAQENAIKGGKFAFLFRKR